MGNSSPGEDKSAGTKSTSNWKCMLVERVWRRHRVTETLFFFAQGRQTDKQREVETSDTYCVSLTKLHLKYIAWNITFYHLLLVYLHWSCCACVKKLGWLIDPADFELTLVEHKQMVRKFKAIPPPNPPTQKDFFASTSNRIYVNTSSMALAWRCCQHIRHLSPSHSAVETQASSGLTCTKARLFYTPHWKLVTSTQVTIQMMR